MKSGETKGPKFIRFIRPILKLLLESGGTSTPAEIIDRSIEIANVSESEQEAVNKNGQSRIKNQVHWSRQYLVWDGYLDSSRRGVWSLTDKGKNVEVNRLDPLELFKNVQKTRFRPKQSQELKASLVDEAPP